MMTWAKGLIAGSTAAIPAALVSLPLHSPDDGVFNTGTVVVGALVVGLVTAALWRTIESRPSGVAIYVVVVVATFVVVALAAVAAETVVNHSIEFVIPLAAMVFGLTGTVSPMLARLELSRPLQLGGGATLVAALALGIALAGQGDGPSGRLELPPLEALPGTEVVLQAEDVEGVAFLVVPGESVMTYTVREKRTALPTDNDAVGRTTALSGAVYLDGRASQLFADLTAFESDQNLRDNVVRDMFAGDPMAEFTVDSLGELPEEYTTGDVVMSSVTGTARVLGVERPLTFDIEAQIDGNTLQLVATTDFTWADFEIDPPNNPFVTVEDNVHIEVLVIARPDVSSPEASP